MSLDETRHVRHAGNILREIALTMRCTRGGAAVEIPSRCFQDLVIWLEALARLPVPGERSATGVVPKSAGGK